jgi:hypothetical protein
VFIPSSFATQKQIKIGLDIPYNKTTTVPQGEISGLNTVTQGFIASGNNLTQIQILFGTWKRKNSSRVEISLLEDNKKISITKIIDASKLIDNGYFLFSFPAIKNSLGKKYYLKISSPDAISGNAVTVWLRKDAGIKGGNLLLANKPFKGSICFRLLYLIN